ncbi:MAG: Peroxide-responsive repressor PerR [Alphaproteobacteria bacterium ADurb.Bin438]|nr:MAG: Peroxide-responsive repressor PerR [Alphaproteobacteria bacterium ADurb.Bin438]
MSEKIITLLKKFDIRPTKQRVALAKILFKASENVHMSAEKLYNEATKNKINVSFATVYNTLNQFTESGLVREVVIDNKKSYFDTNIGNHHHIVHEQSGTLEDVPIDDKVVKAVAEILGIDPSKKIKNLDIIVRLDD